MTNSQPSESSSRDAGYDPRQLAAEIKQHARALGFDLVGITSAQPSQHRDYFQEWLNQGKAGTMEYLARRFEERVDPTKYFPDARSVICVAINYHYPLEPLSEDKRGYHGRIASYALGDDYHELIKTKLYALSDWLRERVPGSQTRCSVDTAPLLERELAARAGIGWIGKNTCVINEKIGSWLLLGEVLTTIALPTDEPSIDHCGTCTRCIDACPTNAITAPYQLDARRCIAYLNIEHKGEIAAEFHQPMGDWLFGCDICQDVCPFNRRAPSSTDPAFQPRFGTGSLDVREVLSWTSNDYRGRLRGSAMKRVKLDVLQRNARIVRENLEARHERQKEGK